MGENSRCSACESNNLKENVPMNIPSIHFLSGILAKSKPIRATVCLDCGKVDCYVENSQELIDKELVRNTKSNFLPFVLFALFVLSLQLD